MSATGLDAAETNLLYGFLANNVVDGNFTDFRKPSIKASLARIYPLFIVIAAFILVFAAVTNTLLLYVVFKSRLCQNPTFLYIANIALSDLIKATLVLPVTIAHLLLRNWLFGGFMCVFLPMTHSIPIHVTMLSYVMIGADRYRLIMHPMKPRLLAWPCLFAVWLISVCVVLPYAVYIKYIDVGKVMDREELFAGVGLCVVNMERHIEEYIRAMFVILYCLPLAIIAFLYVKVSAELKSLAASAEPSSLSLRIESMPSRNTSEISHSSRLTTSSGAGELEASAFSSTALSGHRSSCSGATQDNHKRPSTSNGSRCEKQRSYTAEEDDSVSEPEEINIHAEKYTQKYIIWMVILFAICWCPINLLNIIYNFVFENQDNEGDFDITYVTFILFGFLSTCINPVVFFIWRSKIRERSFVWSDYQ